MPLIGNAQIIEHGAELRGRYDAPDGGLRPGRLRVAVSSMRVPVGQPHVHADLPAVDAREKIPPQDEDQRAGQNAKREKGRRKCGVASCSAAVEKHGCRRRGCCSKRASNGTIDPLQAGFADCSGHAAASGP